MTKLSRLANHQRHEDLIILRDLENHEDRRHRSAHDSGKERPHADECVRAGISGRKRREPVDEPADGAARHRADIQARREDAAGVAGGVGHDGRDQFQEAQSSEHRLEQQPAIQGLVDVLVADTHDCRRRPGGSGR